MSPAKDRGIAGSHDDDGLEVVADRSVYAVRELGARRTDDAAGYIE
jgi:hypothetical protein